METVRESKGSRRLGEELKQRKLKQAEAAALCGVSEGQLSRLIKGTRWPGRKQAEDIRVAFGIDPRLWDEAPSKVATDGAASTHDTKPLKRGRTNPTRGPRRPAERPAAAR